MEKQNEQTEKKNIKKELLEWVLALGIPALILGIVLHFFIGIVHVDGDSMNDTLKNGETVFVSKMAKQYDAGDIIVFHADTGTKTSILIKRVVAVGGDTIDCNEQDGLTVNGKKVEFDDRAKVKGETGFLDDKNISYPLVVPENHVFVLGDNREHSRDSRDERIGCVPFEHIIGIVIGKSAAD